LIESRRLLPTMTAICGKRAEAAMAAILVTIVVTIPGLHS
jgi:hypothetical protein